MNLAGEGFQLALVPPNAVEEGGCSSTELPPTAFISFSAQPSETAGAARGAWRLLDAES
jgi:hypothetical protein